MHNVAVLGGRIQLRQTTDATSPSSMSIESKELLDAAPFARSELRFTGIHEELSLLFASRPFQSPILVDSSNLFPHSWKVQMRAFDHPGGELHDLFCRETLLRNESADNHLADTERSSGLLHGDPQPLI
jgi:hypothetical protein